MCKFIFLIYKQHLTKEKSSTGLNPVEIKKLNVSGECLFKIMGYSVHSSTTQPLNPPSTIFTLPFPSTIFTRCTNI